MFSPCVSRVFGCPCVFLFRVCVCVYRMPFCVFPVISVCGDDVSVCVVAVFTDLNLCVSLDSCVQVWQARLKLELELEQHHQQQQHQHQHHQQQQLQLQQPVRQHRRAQPQPRRPSCLPATHSSQRTPAPLPASSQRLRHPH